MRAAVKRPLHNRVWASFQMDFLGAQNQGWPPGLELKELLLFGAVAELFLSTAKPNLFYLPILQRV